MQCRLDEHITPALCAKNKPQYNPIAGNRQYGKKRGEYARINNNLRARLIFLVVVKKQDVKSVTQKLNINLSTGKQIVMRYRRTGNYSDKRFKLNCVLEDEMADDSEDYEDQENQKMPA